MLSAAEVGSLDDDWKPTSVQQAPGKRGERPPSYKSGHRTMQNSIDKVQPGFMPQAVWFLAGALIMTGLYFYNVIMG